MYEVEAKVALSKADLKRLKTEIPKIAKRTCQVNKKDSYYGDIKSHFFYLRTREKNGKPFLNLKSKKVEKGIEMNQEIKLPLTSMLKFHTLLKKLGIQLTARKEKKGEIYKGEEVQIELNTIKGLGDFLEIEIIVQKKSDIPEAKKALRKWFKQLGFSPEDFEKKYYLELLAEKRKNKSESWLK